MTPDSKPEISFYSEHEVELPGNHMALQCWIETILANEKKVYKRISYVFLNDEELLTLNQTYLQHDTLTDILTFPYGYDPIETDIYISYERVAENAALLKIPFADELLRVMAHGVLHMCGYTDQNVNEKREMREKEDDALANWPK